MCKENFKENVKIQYGKILKLKDCDNNVYVIYHVILKIPFST